MEQSREGAIQKQLVKHIQGGMAFGPIDTILEDVEFSKIGIRPSKLPYSFYELFFHIWIAQKDILEYCTDQNYDTPSWPEEYWPDHQAPESEQEWIELISQFKKEREELIQMILDDSNDLNKPLANNAEHTLLREIEIVIEHNSYHTGQLMIIKRLLAG